jgi:hypothetical protein
VSRAKREGRMRVIAAFGDTLRELGAYIDHASEDDRARLVGVLPALREGCVRFELATLADPPAPSSVPIARVRLRREEPI